MNQEWLEDLERQLSAACTAGAPAELRRAVLADVERELRAVRWDRKLARAAAILLMVGIGLNAALVWQGAQRFEAQPVPLADETRAKSLIDTAIVVAEATDANTGQAFARQLAALSGCKLTEQEIASIDAAGTRDRG